ncbi:MAG: hypothetical protein HYT73_04730 [Candidatus Aenigmarchaeota archaeon]|nr:hypothetical protein [Candidatus Aenigmarchaeota archaeon]
MAFRNALLAGFSAIYLSSCLPHTSPRPGHVPEEKYFSASYTQEMLLKIDSNLRNSEMYGNDLRPAAWLSVNETGGHAEVKKYFDSMGNSVYIIYNSATNLLMVQVTRDRNGNNFVDDRELAFEMISDDGNTNTVEAVGLRWGEGAYGSAGISVGVGRKSGENGNRKRFKKADEFFRKITSQLYASEYARE